MKVEVESGPSYGMARVLLDRGEAFIAESGSMVAMDPSLAVDTRFNGGGAEGLLGWLKAALVGLARKILGGESFFVNHFTAGGPAQQLMLAPTLPGDVQCLDMVEGRRVRVQGGSYLGSAPSVSVSLVWAGLRMLLSREGLIFLECSGQGPLLINSFGAIETIEIDGTYRVDTGHLVAYEGDLTHKIRRVGGWKSTLLSGEGLILEFEGRGTLWLQTRNLHSLLSWIRPQLPA